jgi:ABC-type polar amino acid transport system ATPase subunit
VYSLLGPNGAGKSTLLKMLGLVIPADGGSIWLADEATPVPGEEGPELSRCRKRVFYVAQRPLFLSTSVLNNLVWPLRWQGVANSEATACARQALNIVGLSNLAAYRADHLSGGESQRLALAWAVEFKPDVLLLDEPTANLDPSSAAACEQLVRHFAEQGMAVIVATHQLGFARRVGQQVIFMDEGKITEQVRTTDFFSHPETAAARGFLHSELGKEEHSHD